MLEPCDPNPCPQPWGICCIGEECFIMFPPYCDEAGGTWYENIQECDPNPCVNIDAQDPADLPSEILLHRSSPNPFSLSTVLQYSLPEETRVDLRIYDITGNVVRILEDGAFKGAGYHEAIWDGTNDGGQKVRSGVYFYCFEAQSKRVTQRVILMR
jgi:hypothetical protein